MNLKPEQLREIALRAAKQVSDCKPDLQVDYEEMFPSDFEDAFLFALFTEFQKLQAEQKPVFYQVRLKPTWKDDNSWTEWGACTKEQYNDYSKTPLLHNWNYEARKLYAAPVTIKGDKP